MPCHTTPLETSSLSISLSVCVFLGVLWYLNEHGLLCVTLFVPLSFYLSSHTYTPLCLLVNSQLLPFIASSFTCIPSFQPHPFINTYIYSYTHTQPHSVSWHLFPIFFPSSLLHFNPSTPLFSVAPTSLLTSSFLPPHH